MNQFKIEQGIPVPVSNNRKYLEMILSMNVSESFHVNATTPLEIYKIQTAFRSTVTMYKRYHDDFKHKFKTKRDEAGLRIWRIE